MEVVIAIFVFGILLYLSLVKKAPLDEISDKQKLEKIKQDIEKHLKG